MAESLTIYECPWCDAMHFQRYGDGRSKLCPHRGDYFREVRVFREEDVRPLWEAIDGALRGRLGMMWGARDGVGARRFFESVRYAFSAPWSEPVATSPLEPSPASGQEQEAGDRDA